MARNRTLLPTLLLAAAACLCVGHSTIAISAEDPIAIAKSMLDREINASNNSSVTDLSDYATDVDLINAQGPHWHGKDVVQKNTQQVVTDFKPRLSYELLSAERIAPDVILVISKGTATMPEGMAGPRSVSMHQMRVFVRKDGKWLLRALQSTPIMTR